MSGGITTSGLITLNGAGVAGGGALRSVGEGTSTVGTITLGSAARITSDNFLRFMAGTSINGTNQNPDL
ncbi:hypothetical protein [Roseicyclus sp.]|uniref:hypothetical protein n=1 Tax=Roseicyclus sp. TaxID=1914329 RepID=UPI001BD0A473|nr:hypothetical protein [Roseicyclus sp.]